MLFSRKVMSTCESLEFWHGGSLLEIVLARKQVHSLVLSASRGKEANISICKVLTEP